MARIRSIHPGWFTDEAWVSVSFEARLLGIGIWTECDDQGIFEWKPITLKMRLFPADNLDIGALLAELAAADLVRQYDAGGKKYGAVRNFCRFQRPKKPRPAYPITPEFRTYVGLDEPSGELGDVEEGGGGELDEDEAAPSSAKGGKSKTDGEERRGIGEEKGGARARDRARETPTPAAPEPRPQEPELGAWLRSLVGSEPVLTDLNVRPMQALLDEGLTRDDIASGIAAAMEDPEFRPRSWRSLVGWARTAAKNRLQAAPKARSGASSDNATPTPLPSPAEVRRRQLGMALDHYRGHWHPNWPTTLKPDHPDCTTPEDVLDEARSIFDAERALSPAERAEARGFALARH